MGAEVGRKPDPKPDPKPVKSGWVVRKCRQRWISWRAFKNRTEAHYLGVVSKPSVWYPGDRLQRLQGAESRDPCGWHFSPTPETLVCVSMVAGEELGVLGGTCESEETRSVLQQGPVQLAQGAKHGRGSF